MTKELEALLKKTGITRCDLSLLGTILGHLTDHGLTRKDAELVVKEVLDKIEALKGNPDLIDAAEKFARAARRST